MSTILVRPDGYTLPTGQWVGSGDPLTGAIKRAQDGDVVGATSGYFRRCGPFGKVQHSRPVEIWGTAASHWTPESTTVLRDPSVGSTDAIIFGPQDGGYDLYQLCFQADDRAGVKTTKNVGSHLHFTRCAVAGFGPGPTDPTWTDHTKWGWHFYDTSDLVLRDCETSSIYGEHGIYGHGMNGDHHIIGGSVRWCFRTAVQWVCRMTGTDPQPHACVGDFTIENLFVEDVCLEDGGGGSALTFRGGMPNTVVTVKGTIIRQGCNPAIAAPFNKSVTGCFVVDSAADAWPGGTKELHVQNCVFEIGLAYPGAGNARRSNVKLSDVGQVWFLGSQIINHPGAHPIALEIGQNVGLLKIDASTLIVGRIKFHGTEYPDQAAFKAAHPECFF